MQRLYHIILCEYETKSEHLNNLRSKIFVSFLDPYFQKEPSINYAKTSHRFHMEPHDVDVLVKVCSKNPNKNAISLK